LDYNDPKETRLVTNWLKRITKQYDILLLGVLHLGKGQGETLGHLGSNTDRWSQSTMIVEKNRDNNQFVLKPKYLRSDSDFEPIAITNYDGRWSQVPYIEPLIIQTTKKNKS
jgi:calcineurin-like phosphoesterase family protein